MGARFMFRNPFRGGGETNRGVPASDSPAVPESWGGAGKHKLMESITPRRVRGREGSTDRCESSRRQAGQKLDGSSKRERAGSGWGRPIQGNLVSWAGRGWTRFADGSVRRRADVTPEHVRKKRADFAQRFLHTRAPMDGRVGLTHSPPRVELSGHFPFPESGLGFHVERPRGLYGCAGFGRAVVRSARTGIVPPARVSNVLPRNRCRHEGEQEVDA